MIVAISGYRGFLGSHLLAELSKGSLSVLRVEADVRDASVWEKPFDVLVHLAAATHERFSRDPIDAFSVNVEGILRALEACARWDARMIFPSTCGVCAPDSNGVVSEESPLAPTSPYTRSKAIGESLCRAFSADFGVSCTVLRLFNVYGLSQNSAFLIPYILERLRTGSPPTIRNPDSSRDYVNVKDVIGAIERSLCSNAPFQVLNVGSGESVAVRQVVEMLASIVGSKPDWEGGEEPDDPIPLVRADTSRIEKALGWKPSIDLASGLKELAHHTTDRTSA
tara:strand:- start:13393 stop:14235 length:843 start_codon:yes stop_codon:yes gene_type:complete